MYLVLPVAFSLKYWTLCLFVDSAVAGYELALLCLFTFSLFLACAVQWPI